MPQLNLDRTRCAGEVRGNCTRRQSSGLEGVVGLQSWKSGNLWQPIGPLPMQKDPEELLSSARLCCQNTTNTGANSAWSPTASWQDPVFPFFMCFFFSSTSYFPWQFYTAPHFLNTEILPSGPFCHNETHIPAEALAPVHNHRSGSEEETRKKKQNEDCAVFLKERYSGCFTQQLEAFAVMVKGRFCSQSRKKLERHFGR